MLLLYRDAMSEALSFPVDVVYSDAGEDWVMASIPQVPGAQPRPNA